jgi:hypothetical protein
MVKVPGGVAEKKLSQTEWREVKEIDIFGITSGMEADSYTNTLRYVMFIDIYNDYPRF